MKIIGHRGARGLAPENTLAALQKGLQHHAQVLEFDVHATKDNIVVLHHDPELTGPNGQQHVIALCTYAELKEHKADLTTLEEVFTQISPKTTLYIEVKHGVHTKPIVELVHEYLQKGWDSENLWLASKSPNILKELHLALPDITKVVIHGWSGVLAAHTAKLVGTNYLAMNQRWLWSGFIQSMSKRNWKLMAYTLDDPKKAARWAKYGLYGVITDYPDRFER